VIGAVVILGVLRFAGEKAGLYSTGVGTALLVVTVLAWLVGTLLYVARIADRTEEERERVERLNAAAAAALAERAEALERANTDLAATTTRLERSNEELQRFATVASHDLREPLRVVSGFADLLSRRYGERLGADGNRFVDAITGGVARMDEMISDLLAYARAGRIDQPFEAVDINDVVATASASLQRAIDDSGAELEVERMPTVNGNAAALRQLFQNLIANALKFVDQGPPRVRIWAEEVPEGWRFAVRDNGIGIDPEQARTIFRMFARVDGEREGSGIGLAVCRRVVEAHGGRIWVERAESGGSEFSFTLPRVA
jgi:light-regulated signal transduction histidine kinase (bacteriophytochrome)